MDFNFALNFYLIPAGMLIGMIAGMFWFSPLLFGKPWMKAMGIDMNDIAESGVSHAAAYATSTGAHALLSLVTGLLILNLHIHGFLAGMAAGLLFWLGFNFTSVIKYVFFETRPWALFLIDAGYDILCFTLIGGVFAQWQ